MSNKQNATDNTVANFNPVRNYIRNYLTGFLGNTKEEQDKIICYIDKNKCKKENGSYIIKCYDISKKNKEIAKFYKLNKPIEYVFEDIDFGTDKVYIYTTGDSDIIIKNCKFYKNPDIFVNGSLYIENTSFKIEDYLSIVAKNMHLKNIYLDNGIYDYMKIRLNGIEEINIIDSRIGTDDKNTEVYLFSNQRISFINSAINADKITCFANDVKADNNSILIAQDEVELETKNFDNLNIIANYIVINEQILNPNKEPIILHKNITPLDKKRLELIENLKKLEKIIEKTQNQAIEEYKEDLSNTPISKILKK